jgi:hypothetical protein
MTTTAATATAAAETSPDLNSDLHAFTIYASSIAMFGRCPSQWRYRYVEGLKIPPNGAMFAGTCYHRGLESNFSQKMESKEDLEIERVLGTASDFFDRQIANDHDTGILQEVDVDWSKDEDKGRLKDDLMNMTSLYMATQAPSIMPEKVEHKATKLLAVLGKGNYYCLGGTADLIARTGGKTIIIDHKLTSSRSFLLRQDEADKDLQATAYCLLNNINDFSFHLALRGKGGHRIEVMKTRRSKDEISWFENGILRPMVKALEYDLFPKNPTGWWCQQQRCGYSELCRPHAKNIAV